MNISFSHIDQHQSDNKKVENVTAPKDIPTLEHISEVNNEKRKLEELAMDDDDEEKITIHDSGNNDNITLDIQTL